MTARRTGFQVPQPIGRPGEPPDFSHLVIPVAGSVERPPTSVAPLHIQHLASSVIRVLDDEGQPRGPWAPPLTVQQRMQGLRHMMTLRAYDTRMQLAQRQNKTSFYMTHTGEEAVSCAFQTALRPRDMNFPTYRQAGLLIAAGYPLADMISQVYSNDRDPLKGRQLPVFYSSNDHGFFSISGNLATQFVQAVGWAMACAIKGTDDIAVGWIGEGATAESDFHAALVFASTYNPPVILNVVNNQWAISTFQGIARGRSSSFAARGIGFGIPSLQVDGNDYLAVVAVAEWAAERARTGFGPTFIEYVTYRSGAHSTSDDPTAYRSKAEPVAWPLGDPIARLRDHLILTGEWSESRHRQAEAEITDTVLAAQRLAECSGTLHQAKRSARNSIFEDVFAEMPPHLRRQREEFENDRAP